MPVLKAMYIDARGKRPMTTRIRGHHSVRLRSRTFSVKVISSVNRKVRASALIRHFWETSRGLDFLSVVWHFLRSALGATVQTLIEAKALWFSYPDNGATYLLKWNPVELILFHWVELLHMSVFINMHSICVNDFSALHCVHLVFLSFAFS